MVPTEGAWPRTAGQHTRTERQALGVGHGNGKFSDIPSLLLDFYEFSSYTDVWGLLLFIVATRGLW